MLEIAICDDETAFRSDLKTIIERELDLSGLSFKIREFDCGESLLSALGKYAFDIFFLDIEMKELNGIETALNIRTKNKAAEIIFVTSFSDFVFQGYEVRALHYILKPYEEKKIISVMHTALENMDMTQEKYYLLEQRSGTMKLPLSQTKYFVSERHTIHAVTADEAYQFYGRLNDVELELPDFFIRIHNRYLVNLNHIQALSGNSAVCGSEQLPISRACKQQLSIAFAKYVLN